MPRNAAGMHPADIKAGIQKRFGTLKALARQLNVHRTQISQVLTNPGYSRKTEQRIAEALEVPLHLIWPDRWSSDGQPLPRGQRRKTAPRSPCRTSQKRLAA